MLSELLPLEGEPEAEYHQGRPNVMMVVAPPWRDVVVAWMSWAVLGRIEALPEDCSRLVDRWPPWRVLRRAVAGH